MSFFRRRSQVVYGLKSNPLILAVFTLFFLSATALAESENDNAIKKFAQSCRQISTKIVSNLGKTGHAGIEKLKHVKPKEVAAATKTATWETTKAAFKGPIYPLWFIGTTANDYLRSKEHNKFAALREALLNRWLKDKGGMLVGSLLWGLQQTTGLTANQYHKLTQEFDDTDVDDGIIVVIDNFGVDPLYPDGGRYVYERLYLPKYGKEKVFFLKNIFLGDIPAELSELAEKHGPIKKLDFYGHGMVGSLFPGGNITSVAQRGNSSILASHYTTSGKLIFSVGETKARDDIFAKNAQIRFNSCFVGNGEDGDLFARAIANNWLRNGGTVYTANTQILPNIAELVGLHASLPIVPQSVRTFADHLVPLRGAITSYTLLHETPNFHSNPERIKGPFLSPGSRVTIRKTRGESSLRNAFEEAWASELHQVAELEPGYYSSDEKYRGFIRAAKKAKEKLKSVYEAKKSEHSGDIIKLREVEEYYSDYLDLLPLYAKPWYQQTDLPKSKDIVEAVENLKKRD